MLCSLLAWDATGRVVATLDQLLMYDEATSDVLGMVDFEQVEQTGPLRLREDGSAGVWNVDGAVSSGTWPEWLGARAHDFKVERANGRISALIHKASGHRRERATIEAAIAERIAAAGATPADIRDLVGGPDRALLLDEEGRTKARVPSQRPNLPIIGRRP